MQSPSTANDADLRPGAAPGPGLNRATAALWLALAYGLFVVYGSLVPLEFRALPLDEAWLRFQHTPFLALGVDSRADWVANGVLYAPLGFFVARAAFDRGAGHAAAMLLSIVGCWMLAIGVEYLQLYFPPRTVSLNDILAECIGSVVGAIAAPVLAPWLRRLSLGWRTGGAKLLPRVLELYTGVYLLLCFFPYDLLLSADELHDKWVAGRWSLWIAPHDHGLFFVALQWAVEVAIALPIGALRQLRGPVGPAPRVARAAVFGLALGALIEVGQFFLYSGTSQGVSVLSRGLGVAAGAALMPWLRANGWPGLRAALRPWSWPLTAVYLPLLAAVNGAFSHAWHGAAGAAASWRATQWLPFYYHYYTTEALALYSLGSVMLMYAPLVALGWLRGWPRAVTAAVTALLALAVETAKLFMEGAHVDPTNLLVAVATNAALCTLLGMTERPRATALPVDIPRGGASSRVLWLLALPFAFAASATFPVFASALTAGLAVVAVLVWRRPVRALGLIPAGLVMLDLAPWSGRFFLDEFDLLQGVCLAVAFSRLPAAPSARGGRAMAAAWLLLACSFALGTAVALRTAGSLDLNSFNSYLSPWNAVRIVKGAVDAGLFVLLWRRLHADGARRGAWFGGGMLLGLAWTVLFVVWERLTFASLFDFAADFRVTGPFSAMHKGGAYIECYLAVAAAFAAAVVLRPGAVPRRVLAALLLAGAGYAMVVTYSRNGYVALLVVLAASLAVAAVGWVRRPRGRRQGLAGAVAVLLLLGVALPIVGGGYARQRLAQSTPDLAVRRAHWADGLALRDPGLRGFLLGTGIGRFPQAHFWRSQEAVHAASYALGRDGDTPYLRLAQGATLYIDQIIDRPPFGALTASFEMRAAPGASTPGPSTPGVSLCEKWTLTSLGCAVAGTPKIVPGADGWQRVSVSLDASGLLLRRAPWRAPLKLSLATPAKGTVDVRHVRLVTAFDDELLVDGGFEHGMDRWFFSTDVDPPWHLHSLPLAVVFDQGALGVLAWSAVLVGALVAGGRLLWRGAAEVPAALPAVLGFLASGLLNTLIDAPRFLWLLLVLAWLATQRRPGSD